MCENRVSNAFRHSGHHCRFFSSKRISPPSSVSNAFRHSGHHCLSLPWSGPHGQIGLVSNAFRHSGHHCLHGERRNPNFRFFQSPMPFGIQGITASGAAMISLSLLLTLSPMPFGIQGITAQKGRVHGMNISLSCLQCLSAFRASLPQCVPSGIQFGS